MANNVGARRNNHSSGNETARFSSAGSRSEEKSERVGEKILGDRDWLVLGYHARANPHHHQEI
jgi:hypothetical protein